jgi:hypothetical protein
VEPSLPQRPAAPLPRQVRGRADEASSAADAGSALCPRWCCVRHGEQLGEEDHLHLSDPVVAAGTMIRLGVTIDPVTREQDGPYVLIGDEEYTLVEAEALLACLETRLSAAREAATPP